METIEYEKRFFYKNPPKLLELYLNEEVLVFPPNSHADQAPFIAKVKALDLEFENEIEVYNKDKFSPVIRVTLDQVHLEVNVFLINNGTI